MNISSEPIGRYIHHKRKKLIAAFQYLKLNRFKLNNQIHPKSIRINVKLTWKNVVRSISNVESPVKVRGFLSFARIIENAVFNFFGNKYQAWSDASLNNEELLKICRIRINKYGKLKWIQNNILVLLTDIFNSTPTLHQMKNDSRLFIAIIGKYNPVTLILTWKNGYMSFCKLSSRLRLTS